MTEDDKQMLFQMLGLVPPAPKPPNPLYCTADGLHVHECPNCHTTWSHPSAQDWAHTSEEFEAGHKCPKCGTDQHYKAELPEVKQIDYPWVEKEKS